ncbi:hypothetical protein [Pseudomonas poae]|uniref:hypothetical protein n=1 Tax=Pseudomonas poae TaxID=200451 RepID=UPI00161B9216|nr:hypothetical protein [Pseudomonas poae]
MPEQYWLPLVFGFVFARGLAGTIFYDREAVVIFQDGTGERKKGSPDAWGLLISVISLFGFLFLLVAGGKVFKAKRGGTEERNQRQHDHT